MLLKDEEVEKLAAYWADGALDDLKTCQDIYSKARRYSASLFFLHLAVEKSLKSHFVKKFKSHAPYTHNLLHLLQKLDLQVDEHTLASLAEINDFNLEGRYPSEKKEFQQKATQEFTERYLKEGAKIVQWIFQN